MLSPIIAMIHNTKLSRWHPVIFVEKPLPGPYEENKPVRHKSAGHHTTGFATRQEALDYIAKELRPMTESRAIGEVKESLDKDFAWNGEDVPVMTIFFGEVGGKVVPMIG